MEQLTENTGRRCRALIITGHVILIDEEDYERVSKFKWRIGDGGYVQSGHHMLHRFVLKYEGPDTVDHLFHDKLDNRKHVLKERTQRINNHNRKNASRVRYNPRASSKGKWEAYIKANGKYTHLGSFRTKQRADVFAGRALQDTLNGVGSVQAYKRPHGNPNASKRRVLLLLQDL